MALYLIIVFVVTVSDELTQVCYTDLNCNLKKLIILQPVKLDLKKQLDIKKKHTHISQHALAVTCIFYLCLLLLKQFQLLIIPHGTVYSLA